MSSARFNLRPVSLWRRRSALPAPYRPAKPEGVLPAPGMSPLVEYDRLSIVDLVALLITMLGLIALLLHGFTLVAATSAVLVAGWAAREVRSVLAG